MNKTLLTFGAIGVGLFLSQDRLLRWLSKVSVGFKKLESIHLDWERSAIRPVIWILNENKTAVVLKKLKGRVVYPGIEATFNYNLGNLVLKPNEKVDATFSIEFENEDPFVLLADRLQKKSQIPVEGTIEILLKDKEMTIPFSYKL